MDTNEKCSSCQKTLPDDAPERLCPECLMMAGLETGAYIGPDTWAGKPSSRFIPPSPEELGACFPGLEIMELLGQGGMGAVYKARQPELDRIVALKILPPDVGQAQSFAERFTREAKALAKLNHPSIVTLYEFGKTSANEDDGRQLYYFLMEFIDGVNLRQLLDAGRLSPKEALAIVPKICDALQFAHDRGIVHRDIKPENILMGRDGLVKLADFGVARIVDGSAPHESREPTEGHLAENKGQPPVTHIVGTPHYMAPEQKDHPKEVDHRADIYSLGVVLYQMLTGELPSGNLEPPSTRIELDVKIDEIVLRALERQPGKRYQSATAFKTRLESYTTSSSYPSTLIASPTHQLFRRVIDSRGGRVAAIASVWLLVATAALLLFQSSWTANESASFAAEGLEPTVIANPIAPTVSTTPDEVVPVDPTQNTVVNKPIDETPETVPTANEPAAPHAFSDEILLTLSTTDADASGLVFFDFETAGFIECPVEMGELQSIDASFVPLPPESEAWVQSSGIDLVFHFRDKTWDQRYIHTLQGMVGQPGEWSTVSPGDAINTLDWVDAQNEFMTSSLGVPYHPFVGWVGAFHTRSGTRGVYQMEGFENPLRKGVIFRFRTIETVAPLFQVLPKVVQHDFTPSAVEIVATPPSATSLINRLESARSIGSQNDRDSVLAAITKDAATIGESGIVVRALDNIRVTSVRDSSATFAAEKLSTLGRHAQAIEVSAKVRSNNQRSILLSKVAASAAGDGEWLICLKALEDIPSHSDRNAAADQSARLLAKIGKVREAIDVARTISDPSTRDLLLKDLAK